MGLRRGKITMINYVLDMASDLQKLVKLYTKAEQATTRKKAKKVLKKAAKLEQKTQEG
jgi:hypothetical protein